MRIMERRSSARVDVGIPVEFDTASEQGHGGILQDLSGTGGLLLSRVQHEWHDTLVMRFRAQGPASELFEVRATIVRSEPNDPESVWPIQSAVQFEVEIDLNRDALKY